MASVEFPINCLELKDDCVLGSLLNDDPSKFPSVALISIEVLVKVMKDSCSAWSGLDVRSLLQNIGDDAMPGALKWLFTLHPRVLISQRIKEPSVNLIANMNLSKASFQAMYPVDGRCLLIPLDVVLYLPELIQSRWFLPDKYVPIQDLPHESLEHNAFSKLVAAVHYRSAKRPLSIFRTSRGLSMVEAQKFPLSRPTFGQPGAYERLQH